MLWKSIIHRSAWGNPVGIEVVYRCYHAKRHGTDFRPSGGSGRPPTPSPPHAPTPAHPHTRSCTRIDCNTPRLLSFGKKILRCARPFVKNLLRKINWYIEKFSALRAPIFKEFLKKITWYIKTKVTVWKFKTVLFLMWQHYVILLTPGAEFFCV